MARLEKKNKILDIKKQNEKQQQYFGWISYCVGRKPKLFNICFFLSFSNADYVLQDVREAAKRARDVAKTELQHHEETLVASTRETDRLLSDYKYQFLFFFLGPSIIQLFIQKISPSHPSIRFDFLI